MTLLKQDVTDAAGPLRITWTPPRLVGLGSSSAARNGSGAYTDATNSTDVLIGGS